MSVLGNIVFFVFGGFVASVDAAKQRGATGVFFRFRAMSAFFIRPFLDRDIRKLPAEVDVMVIVGSFTSANTCRLTEISKEKIKTPVGLYNVGDVITARVMNINSDERRIGLSIKRMEIEDEKGLLNDYVNNIGPATSSFGEILRENLQEKLNED
mgnify:CR=1 FL=1